MFAGALANCAVSSRGDGSRERSAQRRTTGASRRGRRLERASLHSALCVRAEEPVPHIYSASGSRAPFAHLARADRGPRACFGRILGGAALTDIAGSGARLNAHDFHGPSEIVGEYVQRQRAVLAIALIYPIAVPAVCFVLSLFLRLERPLAKPVAAIAGIPDGEQPPAGFEVARLRGVSTTWRFRDSEAVLRERPLGQTSDG
jgi:hypothetical protein